MVECMETCQVGVPCPHGKECDHIGAGRLVKYEDDLDILIEKHGDVFPEDWDAENIMFFCCRYVNSNIEDVKKFLDFS